MLRCMSLEVARTYRGGLTMSVDLGGPEVACQRWQSNIAGQSQDCRKVGSGSLWSGPPQRLGIACNEVSVALAPRERSPSQSENRRCGGSGRDPGEASSQVVRRTKADVRRPLQIYGFIGSLRRGIRPAAAIALPDWPGGASQGARALT